MGLLDMFGKRDVSDDISRRMPYTIKTEFVPYKLKSNEKSSSVFVVNLKNMTAEPVLSSIVIEVPRQLSIDSIGITKEKELRLGTLSPNEERESRFEIHGGVGTDKGNYTITLTAFIHYRDYGHVLNAMKKRAVLEVV